MDPFSYTRLVNISLSKISPELVEEQEEKEINRTDGNDVQSKDEINTTAGECMERLTAAASAV